MNPTVALVHRYPFLPALALIGCMALWGGSFPAFKYALGHFESWFLVWARLTLAAVIAVAIWPLLRKAQPAKGDWKWLAVMAICEPCLYFTFEKHALQYTSAAQAGVIVALLPLMVAGAAAIFLAEKLTPRLSLGMALAFLGAVWVSLSGEATATSPRPLLGNALEFLAMASATGYIIALKKLGQRWSPWHLVAIQNVIGSLFFLPFALSYGGFGVLSEPSLLPQAAWLALLYLGVVVSLGAFLLYTLGMQHIPANRATIYSNLIPVFAVSLSIAFLGERLTVAQFFACGLILVGLLISQSKPSPQS